MNFFTPAEVAKNYIATGKSKVNTPIPKMIILAILAGAFIGFGGVGATTVAVSITEPSLGKFIGACVFPGGLTMVLIAGSELFTGNCLLTIPSGKRNHCGRYVKKLGSCLHRQPDRWSAGRRRRCIQSPAVSV